MKKLNITKERFEKSRYFTKKYGKLEYVSESGRLFKTSKGKVLKFTKESEDDALYAIRIYELSGNKDFSKLSPDEVEDETVLETRFDRKEQCWREVIQKVKDIVESEVERQLDDLGPCDDGGTPHGTSDCVRVVHLGNGRIGINSYQLRTFVVEMVDAHEVYT
jgi:hypothetical protein